MLSAGLDWTRFLHLARFHRIEGLVWNALTPLDGDIPEHIRAALSHAASQIAAQNLRSIAASGELLRLFESAGVPLLFLKGAALGALAYGNPSLKSAIDIDLLIEPADLGRAAALLRESGFHLVAPRDTSDDHILQSWHRRWKESVWANANLVLQIDLHTRTADSPRLIPSIDVHSPRQTVDVGGGIRLPTLQTDELFAYLAVHGASSAWFRLKWISDFAALLNGKPAGEIERLYRRSQELGAARAAGQALLLADRLFGTLQSIPALRDELARDGANRKLAAAALRQITGEPTEPTAQWWGTARIHWTQFLLRPGIAYKFSELWRQAGLVRKRLI
jgi:hypothetical protein